MPMRLFTFAAAIPARAVPCPFGSTVGTPPRKKLLPARPRPARSGCKASIPVSRTAIIAVPTIGTVAYAVSHEIFGSAHCCAYPGSFGAPAAASCTAGAARSTDACFAYLAACVEARSDAGTAMTRVRIWGRSRTKSPPSDAIAASIAALVAPPLNFTRMSSRPLAGAADGLALGPAVGDGEADASTLVGASDVKGPSRGGASDGERRTEEDRRAAEQRPVQHAHPLRPERVRAHDTSTQVIRGGEPDLRVREGLREHGRGPHHDHERERKGVIRRECEEEDRRHLDERRRHDEPAAVPAIARVREVHRRRDRADTAPDQQERVPDGVDVQHVVGEEHEQGVEGVAQEDHAEHLDADERSDERAPPHESEPVAERREGRESAARAERARADERKEHEERDER